MFNKHTRAHIDMEKQLIQEYFHGRKARCPLCKILLTSKANRQYHMDSIHGDIVHGKPAWTYRNKVLYC